jgi:hypothetical protein
MKSKGKGKTENKYPECEKMSSVKDKSQVIGEFLEWAKQTQEFCMCVYSGYSKEYIPISMTTEILLAKFFDIDLEKAEKEKRQMLEELRRKE